MDKAIRLLLIVAGVVLAGACGSSDEASTACLRAHGAEVCAESGEGTVLIVAEGWLPGSDLRLDRSGSAPQVLEVGDDGRPVGTTGFVGGVASGPLVIAVSGTAADGSRVDGQIVSDRA